jgi:TonB family protein
MPPTAASEISVSYPSDPRAGLLVAALTLFIDEDGTVAKVRAEAPHAPPDYEKAAIEAFANARFKPGMAGSSAVKTRMVIRVAFDSGVPEGAPNSSAGIRFR